MTIFFSDSTVKYPMIFIALLHHKNIWILTLHFFVYYKINDSDEFEVVNPVKNASLESYASEKRIDSFFRGVTF